MENRVVVTGMGCISPLGLDVETTWKQMREGRSGVRELALPDIERFPVRLAAPVPDFDATLYLDRKEARRMDRFTQFAVASALQAASDGDLRIGVNADPERTGVWIGSGVGGIMTFESGMKDALDHDYRRISPFSLTMFIANMAASHTAMKLGAEGVTGCTTTACSSGSNAIGEAIRVIQRGDADVMLAGGAEAPICRIGIASFAAMQALSRNSDPATACRPFDRGRDGFVMGEGAGVLVLESLEHARARGARIYAECFGYGASCDNYHISTPRPDGHSWARAMQQALKDAGMAPEDIQYINAHGTSTVFNDLTETRAIKAAFGSHAHRIAISSTKSMTGHLLGASGALEAIVSILSIRDQVIPPTIGLALPDEELDLDYTPNEARRTRVDAAMSNTFAFGGHNAVLIFGSARDDS
ncbi:beta-ketoacyl-ACP synthase II [Paenibacillus koleovorans]|uniref:beta-ketoacyl-ACP synthase II n=1 Tax=Paenibacillus koleovorans TaxID=121608 RepID=UPI000FDC8931|nr:beta-ketoacyl-ACP synthase II [Paenibacillus koleovorans]